MSSKPQPEDSMRDYVRKKRADTWLALLRRFSRLWGFLLFIVALVIVFRQIALPFVFALLVAYLLAPLIGRMQKRFGRGLSVVLVYLGIVGLLVAFFGLLLPAVVQDLARLRDAAPELFARINKEWLPAASQWVENSFGGALFAPQENHESDGSAVLLQTLSDGNSVLSLEGLRLEVHENGSGGWTIEVPKEGSEEPQLDAILRGMVAEKGGEVTSVVGAMLRSAVAGTVSFLTKFIITFMLAAFILVDLDRVKNFLRSLIPTDYHGDFDEIMEGADRGMSGVIRGQLMICLVNGVLTYLGLLIFGVKYSLLLALLAGVLSLIPIFGTIVSSIPILLIALVSVPGELAVGKSLAMLAWISGIHLVEANFLNPKIIGESAQIHPVVVVFALLAGESVYGLTGALLAVPVASMIQTVFLFARRRASAFRSTS